MGCGTSVSTNVIEQLPTQLTYRQRTFAISGVDEEVDMELDNLRKSTTVLLEENEKLKHAINRDLSLLFPQVFTSAQSPDDLVDDWLLMDLFEGDKFVAFMKVLFPPVEDLVGEVIRTSLENKQKETSLPEYLEYFRYRNEQLGKILTIMGQEKSDVDVCLQGVKSKLVQSIKIYEAFFGKKSPPVDKLTELFGKIGGLPIGVRFIEGLQLLYETALDCYKEAYEHKLKVAAEQKEEMRHKFEAEIEAIRHAYDLQLQEKDNILLRTKKKYEAHLRKLMDSIEKDSKAHYVDLENQYVHFEQHVLRLNQDFEHSKAAWDQYYSDIISHLQAEIAHMQGISGNQSKEIEDLRNITEHSREMIDNLETVKRESEVLIQQLEYQIVTQLGQIEAFQVQMQLKSELEQQFDILKEQHQELNEEKEKTEKKLEEAIAEIHSKHSEIEEREALKGEILGEVRVKWKRSMVTRIATRLIARAKVDKTALVVLWKTVVLQEFEQPNLPARPVVPYPLNISDEVVLDVYSDAQKAFAENTLQALANRTLKANDLQELCAQMTAEDKPMLSSQLFKIFEEMMGRKYESDLADIRNRRLPKGLPMFLFEHLTRTMGLQNLAFKTLAQFLPGLKELQQAEHPYGLIVCQLLQVFVDNPVHYLLSLYLTKALAQFQSVTEKYAKQKADFNSKRGLKTNVPVTPRMKKVMGSKPYCGGEALLRDVFPFIMTSFEGHRIIGERVIQLLKPEHFTLEEYTTFAICERITKMGRNAESAYKLLDVTGSGAIAEGDFVGRTREMLEVWMPEVNLRTLFRSVTSTDKRLSSAQFITSLNFKQYPVKSLQDAYTISTCDYLKALIQVFQESEKVFSMQIKRLLEKHRISSLAFDSFSLILTSLDSALSAEDITQLWDAAQCEFKPLESLQTEQFSLFCLMHPVGSLSDSVFCKL